MVVQLKCPLCSGTEFEEGYLRGKELFFRPKKTFAPWAQVQQLMKGDWIAARVCKQCKHILLFIGK